MFFSNTPWPQAFNPTQNPSALAIGTRSTSIGPMAARSLHFTYKRLSAQAHSLHLTYKRLSPQARSLHFTYKRLSPEARSLHFTYKLLPKSSLYVQTSVAMSLQGQLEDLKKITQKVPLHTPGTKVLSVSTGNGLFNKEISRVPFLIFWWPRRRRPYQSSAPALCILTWLS